MTTKELFLGFDEGTKARFPWIFAANDIDRRKCHRVVPMQVLSLGMSRTGTASMQAALQKLGYPTSHGFDMMANIKDNDMWAEAVDTKFYKHEPEKLDTAFWDQLLGHVSATTDTPANMFGPELIKAYPDAKVILVERDIETWYKSFERALIQSIDTPGIELFAFIIPGFKNLLFVGKGIMQGHFRAKNGTEYRQNARTVYREHYAEIRELLKDQPERLLEYKLGSGWDPLCRFLEKPLPRDDFPRVNEQAMHDEMGRVQIVQMMRMSIWQICKFGTPALALLLAWVYLRW